VMLVSTKTISWSLNPGSGKHLFTNDGRLVKNRSRVLTALDCSDIKTPINNLWSDFKTICLDNLRKHVPSKHTSTRYSQPWCNRNIRRLSMPLFQGHSTNIAKQEKRKTGTDIANYRNRPKKQSINLSKETFRLFAMFVRFTFFHR
jgi:hypothetical protein